MVPKPDNPLCFAPQGTDSILSNIALGATFFFFEPALSGTADTNTRPKIAKDLIFILPPLRNSQPHLESCGKAGSPAFPRVTFHYCFGGLVASVLGLVASGVGFFAVPVVPVL